MSTFRAFKHSKHCKYTYDCYRVMDCTDQQQAIAKIQEKTGVLCDYALKGSGAWDHPHIIDVE
ncbi:hypothetical protein S14_232 [Shewanella sp. phage 1/4]|uniref:hypothetical protein n=1 Tax=Shewanella phage 1/4 TaxID=1458859 RepID=UPI0004F779CB|nr:hypothetical protein S14_232 [Shewanella sp. phage 1/4]AHK11341.1 hypothetical protein S14_232 [Shewanella sp. phage 1/4]